MLMRRLSLVSHAWLGCAFAALLLFYGRGPAATLEQAGASSDPKPSLASGSGTFVFTGSEGARTYPVTVWYHRPLKWQPGDLIVFVMHGRSRNARGYRAAWIPDAESYGFLLIVPEFRSGPYSDGNVVAADGTPTDSKQWSFTTVEKIFDEVKQRSGTARDSYRIYGHSGGGQFVHRMVLLMPEARIEKAVVANAGRYTMPNLDADYPYGLRGVLDKTEAEARLRIAFGRYVTVLLGEEDTVLTNPGLKTPEAMAQGAHRVERGDTFFETARRQAEKLGIPFRWKIRTVPGAGHSNRDMASAGAKALIGNGP